MGQCSYCGEKAGLFRSQHKACGSRHSYGFQQMVDMAAEAATRSDFNEATLRSSLAGIAKQSYASDDIDVAIARGWARSVQDAISDGILTRRRGRWTTRIPKSYVGDKITLLRKQQQPPCNVALKTGLCSRHEWLHSPQRKATCIFATSATPCANPVFQMGRLGAC